MVVAGDGVGLAGDLFSANFPSKLRFILKKSQQAAIIRENEKTSI